MRISYNWIKKYISIDLSIEKISSILTDIGFPVKRIKKIFIEKENHIEDEDNILDIEITPNRADAMSHYGIARDLYAVLTFRGYKKVHLLKPIINNSYQKDISNNKYCFQIFIEEKKKCIRYSGIVISKIKINPSPNWLSFRLKSIGINPINNIIDVTNFVMHELGQPIHIFDMDQIEGKKIIIRNAKNHTIFESVDNRKRKLNEKDLIIHDTKKPLSIAGIINSKNSNINSKTKNIFLGSAYFDPMTIRSIGKRHFIKTDAKFRFERGVDPHQIVYALQRTAILIKKITKGKIGSDIIDICSQPIFPFKIQLRYKKIRETIGKSISKEKIKKILFLLEVIIVSENEKFLLVLVPPYRIDVQREIDLIEEILRIYGINNIKISNNNNIRISPFPNFFHKTKEEIQKIISKQLVCHGFQEVINYSMNKKNEYSCLLNSFFNRKEINIINPTNKFYNSMRSSLLFGMINCIKYNHNRGNIKIRFFEIGKIYFQENNKFLEKTFLSLSMSETEKKRMIDPINSSSFFYLKGIIEQIFQICGINNYSQILFSHPLLEKSISIQYKNKNLVFLGKIKEEFFLQKKEIFYAEIDWEYLISFIQEKKVLYVPYSKYPTSKRDLSFLIDKTISFEKVYQLMKKKEKGFIKKIEIYDLYEGRNLPKSKKSYTISFFFESKKKTLTDIIINKIMKKIEEFLKKELGAKIRELSQ
ncbi:phenylalanine--tRNA ligase subunit beta [Blattabacterium cuenoti]|uniref:phenylalanine--tRNA ligase subunit beta n=1 Tax=Blattabacterium cuenoti TaxID=1653831 RepID=UPI00163C31C8|nr:phenylalanine--tRNA ligase subunit beta [Blattabacterium cuenoti]